jgi:Family of unknown function (DUF6328)
MTTDLTSIERLQSPGVLRLAPPPSENGGRLVDTQADSGPTCGSCNSSDARPAKRRRQSRPYAELLQEIRIAQTGSQVLLGFLLSLGFTDRFAKLEFLQKALYVGALTLSVAATALLVAPTLFRQLTFRRLTEHQASLSGNRCVLGGLTILMCAILGSLLLGLSSVFPPEVAVPITVGSFIWFTLLWFVFPAWSRARYSEAIPVSTGRRAASRRAAGKRAAGKRAAGRRSNVRSLDVRSLQQSPVRQASS